MLVDFETSIRQEAVFPSSMPELFEATWMQKIGDPDIIKKVFYRQNLSHDASCIILIMPTGGTFRTEEFEACIDQDQVPH